MATWQSVVSYNSVRQRSFVLAQFKYPYLKCKAAIFVSTFLISLIISGKVNILEEAALDSFQSQMAEPVTTEPEDLKLRLKAGDIYKELRLRGYDYGKTFQGILESNNAGNWFSLGYKTRIVCCERIIAFLWVRIWFIGDHGRLQWTGNWVTFLDTMLQMIVVGLPGRSLRLPTRIRSVCVDPNLHEKSVQEYSEDGKGKCI